MRRRISLLSAVLLAATTFVLLGPGRPASAIEACGGSGSMTVNPGLLFVHLTGFGSTSGGKDHFIDLLVGDQVNIVHSFSFTLAFGACVHVRVLPTLSSVTGAGILKGYCEQHAGTGTVSGQPFAYVGVGTFLVLTGHMIGLATTAPLPVVTGSCQHAEGPPTVTGSNPFRLPSGATQFLLHLSGVGLNCTNALPATETLIRPTSTLVLTTPLYGVHYAYGAHVYTVQPCTSPGISLG